MKKPRNQAAEPVQWAVYMTRSSKLTYRTTRNGLTYVGSIEARDEAEAREKALKQLDIRPADQFRISVRRE